MRPRKKEVKFLKDQTVSSFQSQNSIGLSCTELKGTELNRIADFIECNEFSLTSDFIPVFCNSPSKRFHILLPVVQMQYQPQ